MECDRAVSAVPSLVLYVWKRNNDATADRKYKGKG